MASLYALKPLLQHIVRPLVRALAAAGVTANQITLTAIFVAAATGVALLLSPGHRGVLLAYPLIVLLRLVLNTFDGMLAREHGQASALGAVLNELGDVISDSFMYLPLALVPGLPPVPVVAVVFLGIIAEMTGVVSVQIGASRRYDGPAGKSDRAVLLGAVAFSAGLGTYVWIEPALWIAAGLSALTIVQRSRRALRELEGRAS